MFYSKKIILTVFLLVFISIEMFAQNSTLNQTFEKQLSSPDKNYEFVIQQKQDASGANSLSYHLNYKGKTVILNSGLDIKLDNRASEWALAIKKVSTGDWMDGWIGFKRNQKQEYRHFLDSALWRTKNYQGKIQRNCSNI
ncbi:hypothetical protein EOD40_16345 [Flavobacterium sufflavum]|uniref:Glycosyl-hydrolase 97 N-terminal domain-containing protein n=1 Tax=Flavobacterium sufflavum TaxID=1921138 RepID=A0A437KM39_9FLAO|nr:glycoside hydrolase family 97 N-terminal domain-containing protein [Flavobacterium sufflavum]RVT71988.1 hypothetical protein EOD40_16345 [Flavobacterium sufflavum]